MCFHLLTTFTLVCSTFVEGYQISQCGSDGKVDLEEASSAYLTCTGITDDSVKWDLYRDDGSYVIMGSCSGNGHVCAFNGPYVVEWTDNSTSTLIVTPNDRNTIAGTVVCGGNQNSALARCKVRVVYKADRLSNCTASIHNTAIDRKAWTVSASCDVEKMYTSDGNYTCHWIVPNGNGTETQEKGSLSTERFVANKTAFVRGTCSIRNLPVSTVTGTYNYDVIVNPGNTRLSGPSLKLSYEISQCGSDGKIDLEETGLAYLTCTDITDDKVIWTFKRDDSTTVDIGSCTWSRRVCGYDLPYVLKRTDYNTSTLTVTRDHRKCIAGTVICGGNQNSVSARCKVRVVYKADRLSNCTASINNTAIDRKDWTVSASCDVEKMYASDENYTCYWIVPNRNGTETQEKGSLATESFVAITAAYVRGTCSIRNLPMPTVKGTYNYDVIVNPGNTRLTGPRLEIKTEKQQNDTGTEKQQNDTETEKQRNDTEIKAQQSEAETKKQKSADSNSIMIIAGCLGLVVVAVVIGAALGYRHNRRKVKAAAQGQSAQVGAAGAVGNLDAATTTPQSAAPSSHFDDSSDADESAQGTPQSAAPSSHFDDSSEADESAYTVDSSSSEVSDAASEE